MARFKRRGFYIPLLILILVIWFLRPSSVKPIAAETLKPVTSIDFIPLYKEAIGHLVKVLEIPTIRKDENKVAEYLATVLKKEGIAVQLITHPERKDKVSLVAEIGPKDTADGIVLMGHTDVVEVSDNWMYPPFKPKVVDGRIYGRGSLDMKGMVVMEMMTLIALKRQNISLKNKIMFLATPDEESGGVYGAQYLLEQKSDLFKGYKYVLNEGGIGIKNFPSPGQNFFNVQVAEKGILDLEVTATSDSGHASMPPKKYSTLSLMSFIQNVMEDVGAINVTPQVLPFFTELSHNFGFPNSFLLKRVGNPFFKNFVVKKLTERNTMNAMLRNTIAVTAFATPEGGINVIPDRARALLDMRLLPGENPRAVTEAVQKIGRAYKVEVKSLQNFAATESDPNTLLFRTLKGVLLSAVPNSRVAPYLSPAATDNRFFREKGLVCYGIIPVLISMEEVGLFHGTNEYLTIENLEMGLNLLTQTLLQMNL